MTREAAISNSMAGVGAIRKLYEERKNPLLRSRLFHEMAGNHLKIMENGIDSANKRADVIKKLCETYKKYCKTKKMNETEVAEKMGSYIDKAMEKTEQTEEALEEIISEMLFFEVGHEELPETPIPQITFPKNFRRNNNDDDGDIPPPSAWPEPPNEGPTKNDKIPLAS